MITLSGISRYRVKEEVQGFTPYRRCLVDWAPFGRDLRGPVGRGRTRRLGRQPRAVERPQQRMERPAPARAERPAPPPRPSSGRSENATRQLER